MIDLNAIFGYTKSEWLNVVNMFVLLRPNPAVEHKNMKLTGGVYQ